MVNGNQSVGEEVTPDPTTHFPRQEFDLSGLDWDLAGFAPYEWKFFQTMEIGASPTAEIAPIDVRVPGSVQQALLEAGLLPDWNVGLNARQCEWVENRHWIFQTTLPAEYLKGLNGDGQVRLRCLGLDYEGVLRVNSREIGEFGNTFVPHVFDLTEALEPGQDNVIQLIFTIPPRWMGQYGWTSEIKDMKPRYNYLWDWTSRVVQLGIWDKISLEVVRGSAIGQTWVRPSMPADSEKGSLSVSGDLTGDDSLKVVLALTDGEKTLFNRQVTPAEFREGVRWDELPVRCWWPNGEGEQALYDLTIRLIDGDGQELDRQERHVGFRSFDWAMNPGAPEGADPWLLVVNGRPVFMQGVNWTPLRPNFADVTPEETRKRLEAYRDLGMNILRVWGGAFLGREWFYDMCDEMGLMVWQEMPLSSSGVENYPPDDPETMDKLTTVARSYIARRHHHASLLLWSGGNELQVAMDGSRAGIGKPVDFSHPLLGRFKKIVEELDPGRRCIPTSSSGPRFCAAEEEFGKGVHWDVHGPWKPTGKFPEDWQRYWQNDDALLRSEIGAPGASSVALIEQYAGDYAPFPCSVDNLLWKRTSWWVEWPVFVEEKGREPKDLAEYVEWSQARQATALAIAAKASKDRFPACGGFIIWMGHDSFPCMANTAILDFHGDPKPAALAVGKVFNAPAKP